jgi:hypothetical protein
MALTTKSKRGAATQTPLPEIVVAVETFAWKDEIVHRGNRLRADAPVVLHAPHLFVRDGLDDRAQHEAWAALQPRPELTATDIPATQPLQDANAVRALRSKRYSYDRGFIAVFENDRLPKTHPLVAIAPDDFEPWLKASTKP